MSRARQFFGLGCRFHGYSIWAAKGAWRGLQIGIFPIRVGLAGGVEPESGGPRQTYGDVSREAKIWISTQGRLRAQAGLADHILPSIPHWCDSDLNLGASWRSYLIHHAYHRDTPGESACQHRNGVNTL